jgi:hypothetical protein
MAVKINIEGIGEVVAENFAQEDTLKQLVEVMSKSDKTKRREETERAAAEKKEADAKKKNAKATQDATSGIEDLYKENEKSKEKSQSLGLAFGILGKSAGSAASSLKDAFSTVGTTLASELMRVATSYDEMASSPFKAAAGMLQTQVNLITTISKIGVDLVTALGRGIVGIIPMVGDGLSQFVGALGSAAKAVIDTVSTILTAINDVLEKELEKRAAMFDLLNTTFANFAGGMAEMASLAGQSGVGIKNFSEAVAGARPYIQGMGVDAGTAAQLLARSMGAAGSAIGKGGNTVRNELFALGYSYKDQGKLFAQYMAQLKTSGVNLASVAPDSLARQTEEYAKHLKVLSDLTGQDAAQLLQQARAEAQRGALLDTLNAEQSRAFQDAYAVMASLPAQQGPKLQAALGQMLAGGVVTDPVIAGNQFVMEMLKKTAAEISVGNIDMVKATQSNLATAADAYRTAGESATDFATLMNPSGTSAVAQGMSQFGNALREYRYDPNAAETAMKAADSQAAQIDIYNSLTATMTGFQAMMEGITGQALPAYSQILTESTKRTLDFVTAQIDAFTEFMQSEKAFLDIMRYLGRVVASVPGGQFVSGGAQSIVDAADAIGFGAPDLIKSAGIDLLANPGGGAAASSTPSTSGAGAQPGALPGSTKPAESGPLKVFTMAEGGIADGPTSGFAATLHGTEAVVPLPDNRSIPVSLDSSSITAALDQHTGLLNQILDTMKKNNSISSGILQASM